MSREVEDKVKVKVKNKGQVLYRYRLREIFPNFSEIITRIEIEIEMKTRPPAAGIEPTSFDVTGKVKSENSKWEGCSR